jgi:WD40 repeat protein
MGTRTSTLGSQNPPNRNISSPREGQRREFGANGKDTKLFESRESGANKVLHSVTKLHSCPHIVAFGGSNKRVTVLNWDKRETLVSLTGPDKAITQVTGAHGPHCVFASSRDYNVYGWNINSDRPQEVLSDANCVFRGHTLSVSSVTGSPDHCEFLCSGGRDTNVKLWDTSTQQCIRDKAISRNIVTQLQWLGSEMSIVQCSEDRSVKIWDVRTLEVVQVFSGRNILTCCDVSCDGNYIVTGERGSRAGVVVSAVCVCN